MTININKTSFRIVKDKSNYVIKRNNNLLHTPGGNLFYIPNKRIAQLVLYDLNKNKLNTTTISYIKITNTAIDKIDKNKNKFINQILSQIHSDTICYFSRHPEELYKLQISTWKPLLEWLKNTYTVRLNFTCSFESISQDKENIKTFRSVLQSYSAFKLSCIMSLCQITGSLVISLALCDSRLTCEEAFRASQLEESYQLSRWGKDSEAINRREAISADIYKASNYLNALRLK